MKVKDFFLVWKEVFSKWKFSILAIIVALVFYFLNVLIASYNSLISFYTQTSFIEAVTLFIKFAIDFRSTTYLHIYVNVIVLSLLLGMLISLIAYKTSMLKNFSKKTGALATTGIFLGILAPGCAACGLGLLSVLGLGVAAFSFLPYEGAEIAFLSTAIMLIVVFKITKDINEGIKCEVKVS